VNLPHWKPCMLLAERCLGPTVSGYCSTSAYTPIHCLRLHYSGFVTVFNLQGFPTWDVPILDTIRLLLKQSFIAVLVKLGDIWNQLNCSNTFWCRRPTLRELGIYGRRKMMWKRAFMNTRMYPKVSGLAAWSEKCKWYSSLPLGAVVSLFCESV
jgi:hypothetical protein